ncbi:virulence protein [Streptococcus troglodytae]|uniref:Virulence protein n=1 Tax=Streptococcus troglodytae TaxID=1111760 RepID=A0A1L7LHM2_9STRE|nr:virulence protein [Streptococcus troglodytae]
MGLTTWKNAPDGRVLKSDVTVAKNYLQEKEIRQLERTVTSYFDYIEGLIERRNTFTMQGLADSIDRFLSFNEYEILEGKGKISKKQADEKASQEYEKFNRTQKIVSDFDKFITKVSEWEKLNG